MQLLQVLLQAYRQAQLRAQFLGKPRTALQGRTHQAVPGASAYDGVAHLLPTQRRQRVIQTASQAATQFGFTVA